MVGMAWVGRKLAGVMSMEVQREAVLGGVGGSGTGVRLYCA